MVGLHLCAPQIAWSKLKPKAWGGNEKMTTLMVNSDFKTQGTYILYAFKRKNMAHHSPSKLNDLYFGLETYCSRTHLLLAFP